MGSVNSRTYTVLLTPNEPEGYLVTCPALPGLVTEGATVHEARAMARDAIVGYLASMVKNDEILPADIPVFVERLEVEFASPFAI